MMEKGHTWFFWDGQAILEDGTTLLAGPTWPHPIINLNLWQSQPLCCDLVKDFCSVCVHVCLFVIWVSTTVWKICFFYILISCFINIFTLYSWCIFSIYFYPIFSFRPFLRIWLTFFSISLFDKSMHKKGITGAPTFTLIKLKILIFNFYVFFFFYYFFSFYVGPCVMLALLLFYYIS